MRSDVQVPILKLHHFSEHVGCMLHVCVLYWMNLEVILNINMTLNVMVHYVFLGYVVQFDTSLVYIS